MTNKTNITDPETLPQPKPGWRPDDIPLLRAAKAIRGALPPEFANLTTDELALDLSSLLLDPDARDLDNLAATQARLLDALFSYAVDAGMGRKYYDLPTLNVALKAQKQCTTTVKSLHQIQARRRHEERTVQREIKKDANEMNKLLK
jgi:hypothetical protein